MPEIVEVKKYADLIKKNTYNKILLDIKILNGRYIKHGPFAFYTEIIQLLPLTIINIDTKGKFMYITLQNGYSIGITLGLSGGWIFKPIKNSLDNLNKHLNIAFIFESGILFFYDKLSFGTVSIYVNTIILNKKLETIGTDIMCINTTFDTFKERIFNVKNNDKMIGNLLLNQKIISGVGNYLRADSLWLSKISPFRKIKDLSNNELYMLFYNIRLLTWTIYDYNLAIKLNIINILDKLPVDYNQHFLIYNKKYDCYNNVIIKAKLHEGSQIRYIYWVPQYQI